MKLSSRTIAILKNFGSINANFKADSGDVVKTINSGQSLLVSATIAETFPHPFAIYDMRDFLTAVGLVKDPDFDFQEQYVTISNSEGYKIKYVYADPSTFKIAYPSGTHPAAKFSFDVESGALFRTLSACGALSLPELYLKSDGTGVRIGAGNTQNQTANSFEVAVSDEVLPKFQIILNPTNLKLIEQPYKIGVCGRIITFTNTTDGKEMTYIAPSMSHSVIEG